MSEKRREPGFTILDKELMEIWPHLRPHHTRLVPMLLQYSNDKAFPKQSDVAAKLGLKRDAIGKGLAQLVSVGMFTMTPRYRPNKGGRSTNIYSPTYKGKPETVASIIHNLKTMKFDRRTGRPLPSGEQMHAGACTCSPEAEDSPNGRDVTGLRQHMHAGACNALHAVGACSGIDNREQSLMAAPSGEIAAQFPARGCARAEAGGTAEIQSASTPPLTAATPSPASPAPPDAMDEMELVDEDHTGMEAPFEAGDDWIELDHDPDQILRAPAPAAPATRPSGSAEDVDHWDARDFARRYWRLVGDYRASQGITHSTAIPQQVFKTIGQLMLRYAPPVLLQVLNTAVTEFETIRAYMGRAGEEMELNERVLDRIESYAFGIVSDQLRAEQRV